VNPAGVSGQAPRTKHIPRQLSKNWDIVREFAIADFRLRYHDSMLGYLWFLLSPAMMFGVYYFVFTQVLAIRIPNYALYLILGIVSYNFFQDCTFSAMYSLNAKASIIKKIYFARYLIVFSSTVTAIFSFVMNLGIVLVVVLLTRGIPPLIWLVPVAFVCLVLFCTGVGLLLAALYVRFHDLNQIWNVLVLAIFWLTPVVYNVTALPESTQIIMFISPLARILMMFRYYLLYDFFDLQFFLLTILSSVIVFAIGFLVFRKYQDGFAEHL
jgi:ABC-type polysaccharide/polyol phosphate export permease